MPRLHPSSDRAYNTHEYADPLEWNLLNRIAVPGREERLSKRFLHDLFQTNYSSSARKTPGRFIPMEISNALGIRRALQ